MSIFGAMSNMSLECFSEDTTKRFRNGLFANGIWQKREELVGEYTVKLQDVDGKALGLSQECSFDFTFKLPKAPYVILENILKFYQDIYQDIKSEVYISLFFDKTKQDYFLHVPKQKVAGATVKFENDETMLNDPNLILVMESHSHHVMNAFWSGQDKADQKASRLFSVFGTITTKPTILLTAGSNQQEKILKIEDIFDKEITALQEDSDYSVPANAREQITQITYAAPKPATTTWNSQKWNSHYYDDYDYESYSKYSSYNDTSDFVGNKTSIQLKSELIRELSTFQACYSLMPSKVESLSKVFFDYLLTATLEKKVLSSLSPEDAEKTLNFVDDECNLTTSTIYKVLFGFEEEDSTVDVEVKTEDDVEEGQLILFNNNQGTV